MNTIIQNVSVDSLQLHPKLEKIKSSIKSDAYKKFIPSINTYGIIEPLKVVKEKTKYFIVDGYLRYVALLSNQTKIEVTDVQIISPIDADIILDSLLRNTRTKRTYIEIAASAYYLLQKVGKSQGKLRIDLGDIDTPEDFGAIKKDRFEIACSILSLDISPSTLKRLIKIYELSEKDQKNQIAIFERMDKGKSIISVYEELRITKEQRERKNKRKLELENERKIKKESEKQKQENIHFNDGYKLGYKKGVNNTMKQYDLIKKSLTDQIWNDKIEKLKSLRLRISIEDEQIIEEVLKKY